MNPHTGTRRHFRRIHVLPSLLTMGNFACGFLSIVLCLNALYFSTRAQLLEGHTDQSSLSLPQDVSIEYDEAKARRNALALFSVSGARARAGFLFHWACVIIFFGMLFDVLDGKVARHMGADSAFGKELDSLADVTTFGIAPAIIVNTISLSVMPATYNWWSQVITCGVIFAVCAVLRLARYNIESGTADKNIFSGLPSPAALFAEGDYAFVDTFCGWLVGLPFLGMEIIQVKARLLSLFLLLPGLLMVSTIPFSHVANRYFSGKKSFRILVAAVLVMVLIWHEPRFMLFLCFNGYMAAGLIVAARKRLRRDPRRPEPESAPVADE